MRCQNFFGRKVRPSRCKPKQYMVATVENSHVFISFDTFYLKDHRILNQFFDAKKAPPVYLCCNLATLKFNLSKNDLINYQLRKFVLE